MKVFVAGGTGVVGRRAVPALLGAGHDVSVLCRSEANVRAVSSMGARPAPADLFERASVEAAVAGHDVVVNLATHIPPMTRAALARSWRENDRIRRDGAANLAAAARAAGAGRFVQESITFPYADGGDDWIGEDHPRTPSPFTAAVDDAEAAAAAFTAAGGTGVVLRFANFYAADARHTQAFAAAYRRGIDPLVGPPDGWWSLVHADDAGTAVAAALDVPAGTYNVAEDEPARRAELAAAVAEELRRSRIRRTPAVLLKVASDPVGTLSRSQRISNRRFRAASGWEPRHGVALESYAPEVARALDGRRLRRDADAAEGVGS